MADVEVIQVVRTYLLGRGEGIPGSPFRRIEQYWSLDGRLLAENDPLDKIDGAGAVPEQGEKR